MSAPFSSAAYDLGEGLFVRALGERDETLVRTLGAGFAAIEPWARYGMTGDGLGRYLAHEEPGKVRFGISVKDEIAGLVIVQPGWLRGPYVPFLGVLPGFQGRGLGASVLDWIASEAKGSMARNTWIAVSDFNVRARRFYERCGYIALAEIADLVADGRTEILMRKRL